MFAITNYVLVITFNYDTVVQNFQSFSHNMSSEYIH